MTGHLLSGLLRKRRSTARTWRRRVPGQQKSGGRGSVEVKSRWPINDKRRVWQNRHHNCGGCDFRQMGQDAGCLNVRGRQRGSVLIVVRKLRLRFAAFGTVHVGATWHDGRSTCRSMADCGGTALHRAGRRQRRHRQRHQCQQSQYDQLGATPFLHDGNYNAFSRAPFLNLAV